MTDRAGAVEDSANRWTTLAVLTFARIALGFQFQSVGAVAPILLERLHIANTELGWLIGLFSLPGVFLALPGGLLGGRFGDRRVVLASLGLMAVGSGVMGAAETFAVVAVGRLLSAVGAILLNVLLSKLVTDWFAGREMIWAMSIFINAWPVGIGLASVSLPIVANAWSVPAVFYVAAGAAAVGAVGIGILYRPASWAVRHAGSPGLVPLSRREAGLVGVASVPWMLYNVGYALTLGFAPSLLLRRGLSVEEAGLLLGLSTLLMIGSVLLGGASAQWLAQPDIVVAVGLLAFTAGLILLPWAPAWPTLMTVGVLAGLPAGTLVAAPAVVLRPESRGTGMGLFYTGYYAGMTLLPPLAGWGQDTFGRSTAVYFAAAAVLASLPFYAAFRALTGTGRGVHRRGHAA